MVEHATTDRWEQSPSMSHAVERLIMEEERGLWCSVVETEPSVGSNNYFIQDPIPFWVNSVGRLHLTIIGWTYSFLRTCLRMLLHAIYVLFKSLFFFTIIVTFVQYPSQKEKSLSLCAIFKFLCYLQVYVLFIRWLPIYVHSQRMNHA